MSERQTVAGAYAKLNEHERECANRYSSLNKTLDEIKADAKEHKALLWGILLAISGGLAVTLIAIVLRAGHLA